MRIACAWLLLVGTLSNWVGGFLCFEISRYIEVRHEMNAIEQDIAAAVEQQIGTKSAVKMLDDQPRLKGDVYGDAAFATEIAGESVHYTLIDEAQAVDYKEVTQAANTSSSDENHSTLLKSLFQEFEIIEYSFILSSALTPYISNFYFHFSTASSHTSILLPPPNVG